MMPSRESPRHTVHTIGHSTRSLDEFIQLLLAHGIQVVADVRLIPRSRRHPHFNDAALAQALDQVGIAYQPFSDLGGKRRADPNSVNTWWRNESFRGFADYMQTEAFRTALERLLRTAAARSTTLMCAEALPGKCHRSLIADALLARDWCVLHVIGLQDAPPHSLTPGARIEGHRVTYPPADDMLFPA